MADFAAEVYRVVRKCPRGKIVSYGGVAAMLGQPRAARAVGRAMNALPADTDIPWWRVVNSRGEISLRGVASGAGLQRKLLEREGVRFDRAGRICWQQYGWQGDQMSRPVKESVAIVIHNPLQQDAVLTVLRPESDDDLPNVWGLPAGTLRPGESWEDAVQRVGIEKLGVQLSVGPELERGQTERRNYRLEMRLYEASIEKGTPFVPQPDDAYTQYVQWKWGAAQDLQPAAQRGSLCSKLFLQWSGSED